MSKLHDICKEYDFCTPETRAELEANGFDFSVCKFGVTDGDLNILPVNNTPKIFACDIIIPYPTFTDVLPKLPCIINTKQNGYEILPYKLRHSKNESWYENHEYNYCLLVNGVNICESACQMWLKLKKGGFLNG